MRKASFWLILLVLVYGFAEATAWLGYRVLFGENFSFARVAQTHARTVASLTVDVKELGKMPVYLAHPYYGHIMNPNWFDQFERELRVREPDKYINESMNAWGFIGASSPVQPADPAKFVVAITGGSVAAYAGSWGRQAFVDGISKIPAVANRTVELLNLGTSAYKQPQQVMVMSDILAQGGHIDLLINIDGFNEIALARGDDAFGAGLSPFFPQPWRAVSESSFSRDQLAHLGRIALIQQKRLAWAHAATSGPWRYSITATTIWQLADSQLIKQKSALEAELSHNAQPVLAGAVPTTADQRASLGPAHQLTDARALYRASANVWAHGSVLLNNLVASQGGQYVHVLQPNQHFPGSRPAGTADAKLNTGVYKAEVEMGYPYLRSAGDSLVRAGVNFVDMTVLFKSDPEPVYVDTCCHLTKEGNSKLVNAIVGHVAATLGKNAQPRFAQLQPADYSLKALQAHALQPGTYQDGSGVELKRAAGSSPVK